jgi:hypothetical protein
MPKKDELPKSCSVVRPTGLDRAINPTPLNEIEEQKTPRCVWSRQATARIECAEVKQPIMSGECTVKSLASRKPEATKRQKRAENS